MAKAKKYPGGLSLVYSRGPAQGWFVFWGNKGQLLRIFNRKDEAEDYIKELTYGATTEAEHEAILREKYPHAYEPNSGYVDCACRDCFDIAIGEPGDLCSECEDAGCEPDNGECQRDDAYGSAESDYEERMGERKQMGLTDNPAHTVDKVIQAAFDMRKASAGAFATENGLVYSYNLAIGNFQHVNGPYGEIFVLDKRESPSVTTSKHIGYLMRGLPSKQIVVVNDVESAPHEGPFEPGFSKAGRVRGQPREEHTPNARYIHDERATEEHLEHPVFNGIIGGLRDVDTGIRVLFVDYAEDQPFYEGGQWIEVFDDNDELLESTPAPERPAAGFLEAALSAAVADYGED